MNSQQVEKIPSYKPSEEDKKLVSDVMDRINDLKTFRSAIKANPYDLSSSARSIEETWDFCDNVALPHKYSHPEMQDWMSDSSHPLIYAKIDTAVSVLISKNPEVEIAARTEANEKKSRVLEALYGLSWDKGNGRQQLIKFTTQGAKYGFSVGREYHRFKKKKVKEIVNYDPELKKQITEDRELIVHDEPFFRTIPIRDAWFDNMARPYNEDIMRDWCWREVFDYSTFLEEFPLERFPNAKYVHPNQPEYKDNTDKANLDLVISKPQVTVWFYENKENDEFVITDGKVPIYKGPLLNHELTCVTMMWRIRNEQTIYGVGVPEILEGNQEMLDRISNMSLNQLILAIGGSGFYGGTGNLTQQDALLEPKLKKLRDAEKIIFPKVPAPDRNAIDMIEMIKNEADEMSGITKALGGEQVGKTLGEAVLNREAGLRRLSISLNNLEFALERHAKLRVNTIQRVYGRAQSTQLVIDELGNVLNEKLYREYLEERTEKGSGDIQLSQKFPQNDETGELYRNNFKKERLMLDKTPTGEYSPSEKDRILEITPDEITGDYDVRIRAFSTIPVSQTLEESKALETFNIVAKLPDTDIYKAERTVLKARKEDPDDWMKTEEEVLATQQAAQGMPMAPPDMGGMKMQGPADVMQPVAKAGLTNQLNQGLKE